MNAVETLGKKDGLSKMAYAASAKEKPTVSHAVVQVFLAMSFALFLASGYAWDLAARTSVYLLTLAGIRAEYVSQFFVIYVRLLEGTVVGFEILMECSGLVTLLIFTFVSAFTIGLLRGTLGTKVTWFILSVAVGFGWNVVRLASVIAVAYNFGLSAFSFVHYVLAPTIDFVWVVSLWSLGMSWLRREESM